MSDVKFPYTMYCQHCKTGLKIKSAKLVGTRIVCPKCKKRIDVITPDEDGYIPYGVEAAPPPEPEPEPTEEEIAEQEATERKEQREKTMAKVKYIGSIIWLLVLLGGILWAVWRFAIVPFSEQEGDGEGPPQPARIEPVDQQFQQLAVISTRTHSRDC